MFLTHRVEFAVAEARRTRQLAQGRPAAATAARVLLKLLVAGLLPEGAYQRLRGAFWRAYRQRGDARYWYESLYPLARNWRERAGVLSLIGRLYVRYVLGGDAYSEDVVLSVHDATYVVGTRTNEVYVIRELYQERFYDRLPEFLPRAGWTVFDIGANAGAFAVQQALRGARLYAFEPNPDCYRRLTRAVKENSLDERITAFPWAVGETAGSGAMDVPDRTNTTCGRVVVAEGALSEGAPAIQVLPLDEIVRSLGVSRIDLLKIDVEGAEIDVLRGAGEALAHVDRIILEYHSPELLRESRAILSGPGFREVLHLSTAPGDDIGLLYLSK